MMRVGEVIQTEGNQFDQLFFFGKGRGVLTQNYRSQTYGKFQLEVVELPEGSFYGELCILLGNTAYFNLQIGAIKSDKKDEELVTTKNGVSMAMVYSIEASAFKELCRDYPEFGTNIYTRAEIREAYFKHLAYMRCGEFCYNMKVIEIEKSIEGNFPDLQNENENEQKYEESRSQVKYIISEKLVKLAASLSERYGKNFSEEAIQAILCRVTIMHHGTREVNPADTADQYLLLKNTTYHSNLVKFRDVDDFDYACACYLTRRGRRIFLQQHNINQVLRAMTKRWNKFANNTVGLIKNEVSIQDETNFGDFGLESEQLFTISQLSFKRRQVFVQKALR